MCIQLHYHPIHILIKEKKKYEMHISTSLLISKEINNLNLFITI